MRVEKIGTSVERARAEEARKADLMRVESEVAWVALMTDVDLPMIEDDEVIEETAEDEEADNE